jgi:RNA polymerase sigma-70 factor (ECF subfamily)
MPDPPDSAELAEFYRAEWGRLLSALIRDFHDFDLAEEALQDAFASALIEWGKERPEILEAGCIPPPDTTP